MGYLRLKKIFSGEKKQIKFFGAEPVTNGDGYSITATGCFLKLRNKICRSGDRQRLRAAVASPTNYRKRLSSFQWRHY